MKQQTKLTIISTVFGLGVSSLIFYNIWRMINLTYYQHIYLSNSELIWDGMIHFVVPVGILTLVLVALAGVLNIWEDDKEERINKSKK